MVDRAEPEQKEVVETLPPPTITCPGRDGRVVSRFFLKDHVAERNPSTQGRTRVFRLAGHIRHRRHWVMAHNRQRRRRRSRDKGKGPDTATRHRLGSKNAHHAAVRAGREEHRMSEGPERERAGRRREQRPPLRSSGQQPGGTRARSRRTHTASNSAVRRAAAQGGGALTSPRARVSLNSPCWRPVCGEAPLDEHAREVGN